MDYGAGDGPRSIATGDFDGDMILDLAVPNYLYTVDNQVSILLGVGDGTFQEALYYGTGEDPIFIATGDFDADGDIDVACNISGPNVGIAVLRNDGTGGFVGPDIFTGGGGFEIRSGDLDGAIDIYLDFSAGYPSNVWADDALWEADARADDLGRDIRLVLGPQGIPL
mgnify:CR=1 FL=1